LARCQNHLGKHLFGLQRAESYVDGRQHDVQSRIHDTEISRHIIISSARGIVTELERLTADEYVVRQHKTYADANIVFDTHSWIGFRYCDAHWSFLKK